MLLDRIYLYVFFSRVNFIVCWNVSFGILWQVDLFFYRDPEETKEEEPEEVPALPDYADYTAAAGGGDWSSAQIPDSQWVPEIAGAVPPVAGGWTADAGLFFSTKLY